MPPLRALLVDDEFGALKHLEAMLADLHAVQVIASVHTLDQAIDAVKLISGSGVLDLRLGSVHGSALLPLLPPSCAVVITTRYKDFAIQAFEAGVRDYLLKPIRPDRLARCLERLQAPPALPSNGPVEKGFWLESSFSEGKDFVPFDEVLWVAGMRVQAASLPEV